MNYLLIGRYVKHVGMFNFVFNGTIDLKLKYKYIYR